MSSANHPSLPPSFHISAASLTASLQRRHGDTCTDRPGKESCSRGLCMSHQTFGTSLPSPLIKCLFQSSLPWTMRYSRLFSSQRFEGAKAVLVYVMDKLFRRRTGYLDFACDASLSRSSCSVRLKPFLSLPLGSLKYVFFSSMKLFFHSSSDFTRRQATHQLAQPGHSAWSGEHKAGGVSSHHPHHITSTLTSPHLRYTSFQVYTLTPTSPREGKWAVG